MRSLGFSLAGIVLFAVSALAADSPEAVVKSFHQALESGDKAAALGFLSDHVKIFEQGHVEKSREEYAAHHLDSDIEFSKAVKSVRSGTEVSIEGGLAYIVSQSETQGTFQGKPINSAGLETMVLRKIDGAWKIVHIHWSSRKVK